MYSWEKFGINSNSTEQEAKVKYRRLCKELHPDNKTGDAKKFLELQKAWKEYNERHDLIVKLQGDVYTHVSIFNLKKVG